AAIPVYEQVLQDLPRFPRARFQLALSWERLGMADRAARSYEGILADSPESPEATQARTRRDRLHALKTWDPARGPKPREILD
ncbi:MAG TPA: hypothetical protein VJB14_11235, partial [Planctomycetota bacterium]|nr:hypothetical protein [Planctomycetota bacterium]